MVHEIRKIQYQFADAKIDWFTLWWSSRFTRYCTLNSSYCKKRHIFCITVWQTLISINKSTRLPFKICWRRVAQNVLWITLIWLKKKETLGQVFPCEFRKISKNIFFTGRFWATASAFIFSKKWRISLFLFQSIKC